MISKRSYLVVMCIAALMLSGCIGTGDNSSKEGLHVHFGESHIDLSEAMRPARLQSSVPATLATGGYDHVNIEHHAIKDKNGRSLAMYRAYIVIDHLELLPCASLAQLTGQFLRSLIPSALAHGGHGSEPVGGRALDAPNVIDIVTAEDYILPLGDSAIAPGAYCGMQVSLVRLASMGYGKPEYQAASTDSPVTQPEIPELSGLMFTIRADYCSAENEIGVCTERTSVDIDDGGMVEPVMQTIEFATPLEVNSGLREVFVVLGIDYGRWLHNVDVTLLGSSSTEKQKMLDNIAASLHLYRKGLGELPPNI